MSTLKPLTVYGHAAIDYALDGGDVELIHNGRPIEPDKARDVVDQCEQAVHCIEKHWGDFAAFKIFQKALS